MGKPRSREGRPVMDVHVGRQPIFDRALEVYGYELLFRGSDAQTSASMAGDLATTRVIVNTFAEFGLERLVNGRPAFVNVTRGFVTGLLPIPLPPDAVVLELLENIPAEPDVLEGLQRLRSEGFVLALDDYAGEPERRELLQFCSYVKIDLERVPAEQLPALVASCGPYAAELVAERVESTADMERCLELGFHYFQGYHLLRPEVVTASAISPSQLACFQLLAQLNSPDISISDLEETLRTDIALNYRLLRAVNAAYSGATRRISSIRDALVLIGLARLRSWLLLLAITGAEQVNEEVLSAALTRARTCELLATSVPGASAESAFVVGLLSSLDDVLGVPMDELLTRLPLSDEIEHALLQHAGPLGGVLRAVQAYELQTEPPVDEPRFDSFEMSRSYLSAVGWSLQVCASALARE